MKRMKRILTMLLIAFLLTGVALAESVPESTIYLTGLMNAAIAVLGALVTYRLLPWIRARTTQNQQEGLTACARTLVYAAEQLYRTGVVQDRLKYVEDGLRKQGYTVDRDAIEAAVTQLKIDTCAYAPEIPLGGGSGSAARYGQAGRNLPSAGNGCYNRTEHCRHADCKYCIWASFVGTGWFCALPKCIWK